MNFTFEITDLGGAERRLQGLDTELPPDYLISIVNPGDKAPRGYAEFRGPKLLLRFLDLCAPLREGSYESPAWRRPERADVAQIIEFGRGIRGGHLLVHCLAGISRSSAATLIVMATQRHPREALVMGMEVFLVRRKARPNDLMLSLADEQLGWGGTLAALGPDSGSEINFLWRKVG